LNLHETIALLEALRVSGVTRFKSHDFEIDLSGKIEAIQSKPIEPTPDPAKIAEANEKLKNLMNTIKMSPEELANKIFPDGAM
jgi:hypothetical protein